MSRTFNPVSTAVAIATAGLVIAIAGCASQRTNDENVGLSQDADTTPTLAQATPTNPLDNANTAPGTDMPGTTASTYPSAAPAYPSTASLPADTGTAMPAESTATTTMPGTASYPSSSTDSSMAGMDNSTAPTTSTYNNPPSSDTSGGSDQALPPRPDRH